MVAKCFLYKVTVASGLVLRVVISVFEEGWWKGGAHHKNQLNVLPPPTETDILHIIAPSHQGCISSLSKHASQEVPCVEQ